MALVNTSLHVDDKELWGAVFGASPTTWEWWRSIKFLGDADWETPGKVELKIADPNDAREMRVITKVIGIDDLALALGVCISGQPNGFYDIDNLDADSADNILQTAMLGAVVYG